MRTLLAALLALFPPSIGWAAERAVEPGGDHLRRAVAAASAGDVLNLADGVHAGPIEVRVPLTIRGSRKSVVDGGGQGSVITVSAPDVLIRGIAIRGSGSSLPEMHSGIFVTQEGDRAVIEDNFFDHTLFGVYLHGPDDALVRANEITGRTDLRMSERGNGVNLWNTPGSRVEGNYIHDARDGIFTNVSRRNVFTGNRIENLRYAIHYMYTEDSEVSSNTSTGNDVGWALMFSKRLVVRDNVSEGDRDHGLMLSTLENSQISGNVVRRGGEKCVFIFNANKNAVTDNWFEGCPVGIHYTAGSDRNLISGNAFINNRTQVRYTGTRKMDWGASGRGNYYSDNPAFDLNGDGIADQTYRPNDVMDQLLAAAPLAKVTLNSPAAQLLRWAQATMPGLLPGSIVDSAPLMAPPRQIPNGRIAWNRP
ncbi:MAG: nitrous oxide reductase family maturation protein NosD [Magnetospirillum sp.]|nr:nitrous oxide reductase family maturation protein NosD [Magnetospirillum sp.]